MRLEGQLDPGVGRWLWLVKWLLLIPHFIVLLFLWIAFSVLTFIAGFAILFTARYPRSLFDFNLGVLRWTLAGRLLRLRGQRHRPVPAVHPGSGARLSGVAGDRLSGPACPAVWSW